MELDTVQYFDFESGRGEQDEDMDMPDELEDNEISDVDRYVCYLVITHCKLLCNGITAYDLYIVGTSNGLNIKYMYVRKKCIQRFYGIEL